MRSAKVEFRAALVLAAMFCVATRAEADDVTGVWLRDTGNSKVRFTKCGDGVCGYIAWLKESGGPAKIGERVFFDMKSSGDNQWRGSAFNPEDGKTYTGKMTLSGSTLTTSGCVLGGLICKSVNWTRSN